MKGEMDEQSSSRSSNKHTPSTGMSPSSVAGISILAFAAVSASMAGTIWRSNRARNRARQAVIDFRSNYHIEKRPLPLPSEVRSGDIGRSEDTAQSSPNHTEDEVDHFTYGDAAKALLIATSAVGVLAAGSGYYVVNKLDLSDVSGLCGLSIILHTAQIQDTKIKLNAVVRTRFKTLYDSIHKSDGLEEDIPDDAKEFVRQFYGEQDEKREV